MYDYSLLFSPVWSLKLLLQYNILRGEGLLWVLNLCQQKKLTNLPSISLELQSEGIIKKKLWQCLAIKSLKQKYSTSDSMTGAGAIQGENLGHLVPESTEMLKN